VSLQAASPPARDRLSRVLGSMTRERQRQDCGKQPHESSS
jgi:hypothetical protein